MAALQPARSPPRPAAGPALPTGPGRPRRVAQWGTHTAALSAHISHCSWARIPLITRLLRQSGSSGLPCHLFPLESDASAGPRRGTGPGTPTLPASRTPPPVLRAAPRLRDPGPPEGTPPAPSTTGSPTSDSGAPGPPARGPLCQSVPLFPGRVLEVPGKEPGGAMWGGPGSPEHRAASLGLDPRVRAPGGGPGGLVGTGLFGASPQPREAHPPHCPFAGGGRA